MNVIERLRENVESMLEPLAKKPELSPTEIENATKAMCLLEKIREYGDSEDMENGASFNYRDSMYPNRARQDGTYMRGYSRRRDSRGRYSRNGHEGEYSRHSIHDRMIAKLEEMIDEAKSDYERNAISDWISRLENEAE